MASHSLVSGLPRIFSSLPPSLAPSCTPCVAGRLRATPHSSSLRPATAPFQNLHLDVWGPAPTLGPERERYFLVVVDDYSRYTTVFPLAKKSEGCLVLVRDTSVDKLSAGAIPCIFLGFPVGSPDYSFYHPPLHQFLDPCDIRFDYSVSYYTQYPCRGRPVPPPPSSSHPLLPLLPLLRYPCPPLVLPRQVCLTLPLYPRSHVLPLAVLGLGVGAGGAGTGGASSGGVGAGGASSRGAGAGGAGAGGASSGGTGAGGPGAGGASSRGAGAGGVGVDGASSGGTGAGGPGAGGASYGGAGAGGAGAVGAARGAGAVGAGEAGAAAVGPAAAAAVPSSEWPSGPWSSFLSSCPLQVSYCVRSYFPPPNPTRDVFSPQSQSSPPVVPHDWTSRCPPHAWPSSPLADLRTVLFHSIPRRSPPVSVLPSPLESSLTISSYPITDYYRAARPVVSRVLATLVTDPRASPLSVSALTAAVTDFASTRRLDYTTRVVDAPPPCPLSVGGDVLARFVATGRHRPVHWTAAVRVAKYLATTSGMGLVLGGTQPVVLTGNCDTSYADDVETQRSTQGYCFSLGTGAVSWRSTRSSSVALSNAVAEIYAGAMAAQELRRLTFLLTDLGERPRSAPTLYADNKAMILLCRETRLESRVKHIDVRYFLLR
ncbi:unnamed protein product [Closterium sp. NIES-54]